MVQRPPPPPAPMPPPSRIDMTGGQFGFADFLIAISVFSILLATVLLVFLLQHADKAHSRAAPPPICARGYEI